MAERTRDLVVFDTFSEPLITRETVATDTSASLATSFKVAVATELRIPDILAQSPPRFLLLEM